MATCKLCHRDKKLCNSHIVPEFLFKELYDKDRKLMAISGTGNKGWKPLQKGLREKLLCGDCEQLLNEKYEKPFMQQWYKDCPLPDRIDIDSFFHGQYDYSVFKLFHLSVLFRESVSSLPTFNQVQLGVHEDRLRQMILNEDPGGIKDYPIAGYAVLNNSGDIEKRLIGSPIAGRYEGHIFYGQIYGGALWWISVSSHINKSFMQAGIQGSGELVLAPIPWNEIPLMQEASYMLNRASL